MGIQSGGVVGNQSATCPQGLRTEPAASERPRVQGKFLFAGGKKLHVKGVTYGVFQTGPHGFPFPDQPTVRRDFELMAANGINAIRTYTVPPGWFLDLALEHGIRVMAGLPWEQHVTFLDDKRKAGGIIDRLRQHVKSSAGHPALLCYAIGNEVPPSIVRWHGPRRIERFLRRLYLAVKEEDPEGLVTYVNFPPTEYLQLPFLDLVCFNVYLETQPALRNYIARLQNISGDRPLLLTEVGLDSLRNGEEQQASVLSWQIREAFLGGCAGLFVFSWTDEWHRGGADILDWDFGLTRRDRSPKPALGAVERAFADAPFPSDIDWPEISVVVCTFNGSRTIADTLRELQKLNYPRYEIIVVDDGSTDGTAEIIRSFPVRVIRTPNRGLSAARNTGLLAATGEIVAYIDDDAYPDPDWLCYLALGFLRTGHAAIGGPNIPPPGDGLRAECVANAPGGPIHVLLEDETAEHIPGCNMAFRAGILRDIGGFDPQFRVAGDDVDICWRLQQQGYTVGFNPAAVVWHHRRNSLRAYSRQQVGYGRAEAMLAAKWPDKYSIGGNLHWQGRLYGRGLTAGGWFGRNRIYHGVWGCALFQTLYSRPSSILSSLPSVPAWHILNALLLGISLMGLTWSPLLFALPLFAISAALPLPYIIGGLQAAVFRECGRSKVRMVASYLLTAGLYFVQPVARLFGRLLARDAARAPARGCPGVPRTVRYSVWSQRWRSPESWLEEIESRVHNTGALVARGGAFDDWDLETHGGLFCHARLRMAVEEHGEGRQMLRFRLWPRPSRFLLVAAGGLLILGLFGLAHAELLVAGVSVTTSLGLVWALSRNWTASVRALREALFSMERHHQDPELEAAECKPIPRVPQQDAGLPLAVQPQQEQGRLAAGNRG